MQIVLRLFFMMSARCRMTSTLDVASAFNYNHSASAKLQNCSLAVNEFPYSYIFCGSSFKITSDAIGRIFDLQKLK
jgi:hypothetical protein